jgi:hypothetical protein
MMPQKEYLYRSKEGDAVAKVIAATVKGDVHYIVDGDLRTCTLGEFHRLFDLLSQRKQDQ